jgi:hypothetical protein
LAIPKVQEGADFQYALGAETMANERSSKVESVLCGVAGEYFVAAELSRRGYIASITLRNTRGVDILASNGDATRSVGIQVKTNQRGVAEWIVNDKIERPLENEELAANLFFVFVSLPSTGSPSYHIISRTDLSKIVRAGHEEWLAKPGRDGRQHSRQNSIRKFADPEGQYRDKWSILGLG